MSLSTHTLRQLNYAEGYLLLGMKTDAAEALEQITGVDHDATPVLALWMTVHNERGDWARAAEVGARVCEREPQLAHPWIQWAYATRRNTGIEAAREILMRGVGLHPREAVFHFNLACYEAQLGHLDDARAFLDTACGLEAEFTEFAKTDPDLAPLREQAS